MVRAFQGVIHRQFHVDDKGALVRGWAEIHLDEFQHSERAKENGACHQYNRPAVVQTPFQGILIKIRDLGEPSVHELVKPAVLLRRVDELGTTHGRQCDGFQKGYEYSTRQGYAKLEK